jgi:hypothetical protein
MEKPVKTTITVNLKVLSEVRDSVTKWLRRKNGQLYCPFGSIISEDMCVSLFQDFEFINCHACPCEKYEYTNTVKALEEAIAELDKNMEVPND